MIDVTHIFFIVLLLLFTSAAVLFPLRVLLSARRHLSLESRTEFELMAPVNAENENSVFITTAPLPTVIKRPSLLYFQIDENRNRQSHCCFRSLFDHLGDFCCLAFSGFFFSSFWETLIWALSSAFSL